MDSEELERRRVSWGGSEISSIIHYLLDQPFDDGLAKFHEIVKSYDGLFRDHFQKTLIDEAVPPKRVRGLSKPQIERWCYPRTIYRKAGLMPYSSAGRAARLGLLRELELLRAAQPDIALINIAYVDQCPRQFFPLIDRHEPALSATPDSWGFDALDGSMVPIELKTTVRVAPADSLPLKYLIQLHAQMAVMDTACAVVAVGHFWAADFRDDGPVQVHRVHRNEELIKIVRLAARQANIWTKEIVHGATKATEEETTDEFERFQSATRRAG